MMMYHSVLQCHSTKPENAKVRDAAGAASCTKDIFQAAVEGDVECIKANLDLGVDINKMGQPKAIWGPRFEKSGLFYATPLHYACSYNRELAVKLLLQRGARADVRSASGLTCKEYARRRGYTHILVLLDRSLGGGGGGGADEADDNDEAGPQNEAEEHGDGVYEDVEAEAAAMRGGADV